MKTRDVLKIVKELLEHLDEEDICEICWYDYDEDMDEEFNEEEREEVTEHVKDNSPESLKEENQHLRNVIDMLCEVFGLEQYETNWKLAVSWEKWLIEEIAKARRRLERKK